MEIPKSKVIVGFLFMVLFASIASAGTVVRTLQDADNQLLPGDNLVVQLQVDLIGEDYWALNEFLPTDGLSVVSTGVLQQGTDPLILKWSGLNCGVRPASQTECMSHEGSLFSTIIDPTNLQYTVSAVDFPGTLNPGNKIFSGDFVMENGVVTQTGVSTIRLCYSRADLNCAGGVSQAGELLPYVQTYLSGSNPSEYTLGRLLHVINAFLNPVPY